MDILVIDVGGTATSGWHRSVVSIGYPGPVCMASP